jgi:hypothetical protein
MAKIMQRRQPCLFSPHLRQLGGCSRPSRRQLRHEIRKTVAALVLAAAKVGNNPATRTSSLTFTEYVTLPRYSTMAA